MKKMMSLFLAMAMAFALAIPAFAQQNDPTQQSVSVQGLVAAPTIQIEAPSDVALTLNPYEMKYNGDIKLLKDHTDQILSLPAVFVNKTDGKLKVELEVTANTPDSVQLMGTTAVAETTKKVFLQMQFGMMADKTGAWLDNTEPTKATVKYDTTAKKGTLNYKIATTDFSEVGKAPALEVKATDGKTAEYFGFLFSGDMAKTLATGAWDSNDAIPVTVALKFNPVNSTVS